MQKVEQRDPGQEERLNLNPELCLKEGLGIGRLCEYCLIRNNGTSIAFTSIDQYARHVLRNHPGFSVYASAQDLERFRSELPMGNDYQRKLRHKMKEQLMERIAKAQQRARVAIPTARKFKVVTMEETKPEDRIRIGLID